MVGLDQLIIAKDTDDEKLGELGLFMGLNFSKLSL